MHTLWTDYQEPSQICFPMLLWHSGGARQAEYNRDWPTFTFGLHLLMLQLQHGRKWEVRLWYISQVCEGALWNSLVCHNIRPNHKTLVTGVLAPSTSFYASEHSHCTPEQLTGHQHSANVWPSHFTVLAQEQSHNSRVAK